MFVEITKLNCMARKPSRAGAGGKHGSGILEAAELYDPATGMWTLTGSMAVPREGHTARLLSNGQVLVAGGTKFGAQLYKSAP